MDLIYKINKIVAVFFKCREHYQIGDKVQYNTELGTLNGQVVQVKKNRITVKYNSVNGNVIKSDEFFLGIWKKI